MQSKIDLEIDFIQSLDILITTEHLNILLEGDIIKTFPIDSVCTGEKRRESLEKVTEKPTIVKQSSKIDIIEEDSRKVRAQKLLLNDWSLPSNLKQPRKFDLQPSLKFDYSPGICKSDPSLNKFIKIPRFSLNRFDYNTTRKDQK